MKWTAVFAVAAALVCLAPAETRADCPPGWDNVNDETEAVLCFHFRRAKATWDATLSYCNALGGILAKLTDTLHQKILRHIGEESEAFWIGGTDLSVEGRWVWVNDGSEIPKGPPHWFLCDNEPQGGSKKNCLCLFPPDFYFHACTCDHLYYGICQL
ncbi:perlucin-like protein isoform X2 [Eriocheir sinensis]|uniref:C-type lectin n=1 Tax=Eriocheir sinensis TaxID=95602 RepID=L7TBS7_ERISI|nr:perlucin-like protein isoform X2 [Eriocheir sinensis]AGC31447.1 C-type lectin [Eriocheir sinensis]